MVSKYNKFIFLLPPKTASTSFTHCLLNSDIKFIDPVKKKDYPIYHLTLSEIIEIYNISKNDIKYYKIIQIVRNPYDRFISAWIHQREILKNTISLEELVLKLSETKDLLPNNLNKFYKTFYNTIQYKYKSFHEGNWGGTRFWFEQNWWNDIGENVQYFKLEDIKNDIDLISNSIGVKLNKLEKIKPNSNSHRNDNYRYYYTKNIINNVKSLYINDIIKYGYEF